ncbi:MAG TPA: class I adenylate-forming enzyme family protein [Solirubrobacterales bacterium]|jgi:acyl-CoA synthetase (AMP-forming)/AMP-acid ligase II|nr:class I adenylate-forming enzyme family protein [Solirubrobacterales bacterium]
MLIDGAKLNAPAAPLSDLLRLGLDAKPDDVALLSNQRSLTWRELEDASSRLAAGYRGLGLAAGDRVASLMPNRVDLVVHYLACFKAELIATPLNYRYTATEIDHALRVSGARALLAHEERAADVAASELASTLELGTIAYRDAEPLPQGNDEPAAAEPGWEHDFARLLEADPLPRVSGDLDPGEPAVIFFTSGSTGPAKGVTHTRETLRWMIAAAASAFELDADDVFLPGSSMSHVGGFLWALATLAVAGRVVVARATDAHELLPLLRDQQPTVLAMIPAALSALIHDHDLHPGDFASLRICRAGADKVSTELLAEFAAAAGFPIVEGYGMTEVGLATLNPPSGEIRQGSIGTPIGGFRIELRGDDGGPIEGDAVGRIWIESRSRMSGYWEAPDATAEVVVDGWLDSGDLARADADGYLWFFGRKKQVIVHDGSNISPYEVEGALVDHPAVALAGAVGVHDTVHGENVRAYVTLAEDCDRPSAADLIVHCRERIGYKAPEEIVVLDEMPLNPTGKIDRVGLKRMAEDHLHPHGL